MENALATQSGNSPFEQIKKIDENGNEYWEARALSKIFDYSDWRNFIKVINKAMTACTNSGKGVEDQFVEFTNLIEVGKQAFYKAIDYKLTRYACYLIAQNGDPSKEQVALAQTYFAVQTRAQEVTSEYMKEMKRIEARKKLSATETKFATTLYERGVDGKGIAEIRASGDQALFGGKTTQAMKAKMGIDVKRPLADFLPTVTIKAKDLAAEMTTVNTQQKGLLGKHPIKNEHVTNNQGIRKLLKERGIVPEELPAEEDVKKLEKKYDESLKLNKSSKNSLSK